MTINPYRFAVIVVCVAAMLAVPVFMVGSTFTRAALVVAVAAASCLIYRHGRPGGGA